MKHPHQIKIIKAIKAGIPYKNIRERFNCGESMILYQRKKLGLHINEVGQPHPGKPGIIKALRDGEKWEWIAKEFNASQMTISRYRREAGISNRYKLKVA